MTSPSTRRRSLESTMSLIQGVLDGKSARIEEDDDDMNGLTDRLAGSSVGKNNATPGSSRSAGR
jgi:serine/threonine-protein phosphatase 2B catalytic subunit